MPEKISNKNLSELTGVNDINIEIRKRRWRWLGHVLRMDASRHTKTAIKWTPAGKRKKGRPKGTWRRTIDQEMKCINQTWNGLGRLAQDRCDWREAVEALFTDECEED